MLDGAVDAACQAWSEAWACGETDGVATEVARFAWVAVDARRAHLALAEALRRGELGAGDRRAWKAPVEDWQRALHHPQEASAWLGTTLGTRLDRLDVPRPEAPFLQPPADVEELWVGTLAALGRFTEADAVARALPDTARGHETRAAPRHPPGARRRRAGLA